MADGGTTGARGLRPAGRARACVCACIRCVHACAGAPVCGCGAFCLGVRHLLSLPHMAAATTTTTTPQPPPHPPAVHIIYIIYVQWWWRWCISIYYIYTARRRRTRVCVRLLLRDRANHSAGRVCRGGKGLVGWTPVAADYCYCHCDDDDDDDDKSRDVRRGDKETGRRTSGYAREG